MIVLIAPTLSVIIRLVTIDAAIVVDNFSRLSLSICATLSASLAISHCNFRRHFFLSEKLAEMLFYLLVKRWISLM